MKSVQMPTSQLVPHPVRSAPRIPTPRVGRTQEPEGTLIRSLLLGAGALVGAAAALNAWARRNVRPLANTLGGTEGWFDWRGYRIAHTAHGAGSPVLLLHSIHASAHSEEWRRVIEPLARHHRVYTLDLIGFGRSERPGMRYTPGLFMSLIADFARRVVGEPVALVASSTTAAWAIHLAARDPGRFPALVLVGPTGLTRLEQTATGPASELARLALRLPVLGTAVFNGMASRANIRAFLRASYADDALVTDELVDAYHASAHQPGARHAPAAFAAHQLDVPVREPLRRLVQPTLVLWGERARMAPVEDARAFMAVRRDVQLDIMEDTGDFPHAERPAEFSEAVVRFLERAGHRSPGTGTEAGRAA